MTSASSIDGHVNILAAVHEAGLVANCLIGSGADTIDGYAYSMAGASGVESFCDTLGGTFTMR